MTTLETNEVDCFVCGRKSAQDTIVSSNMFGSPDLDLRPPEMQRSTMPLWLQECPHCGYVGESLSAELSAGKERIVAVLAERNGSRDGTLMGRFITGSLISEITGDRSMAAKCSLWAAWAADDADDQTAAEEFRLRAADLFGTVLPDASRDEAPVLCTRMVDILRRARRWSAASVLSDQVVGGQLPAILRAVVDFERRLIASEDANCYTVKDAMDHTKSNN